MKTANEIILLILIIVCVVALILSLLAVDWTVFTTGEGIFKEFRQVLVLVGLICVFTYHYLPFLKGK